MCVSYIKKRIYSVMRFIRFLKAFSARCCVSKAPLLFDPPLSSPLVSSEEVHICGESLQPALSSVGLVELQRGVGCPKVATEKGNRHRLGIGRLRPSDVGRVKFRDRGVSIGVHPAAVLHESTKWVRHVRE